MKYCETANRLEFTYCHCSLLFIQSVAETVNVHTQMHVGFERLLTVIAVQSCCSTLTLISEPVWVTADVIVLIA